MIRFLQTPGPVKKIVLGGLLLIICVAMLITLIPGGSVSSNFGFGAPGRGVVAKVAGEEVTALEVQQEAKSMLRQQFPKGTAMSAQLIPFFAQRAADQLINQKALVAEAQRLGLKATDEDLLDDLQHGQLAQTLFPGGNFIGKDAYEDWVSRLDMSVPQFEQIEKNFILIRKLQQLVANSASVTEAELHDEFQRRNTKVKFDYAVLNRDDILKGLHPTDEELKAFYERSKASYNNSIPEKRKVKFALVDTSRIQNDQTVSKEELEAYYHQHQDEFRVPEQVNVRHILIKTPLPGADGKTDPKGVEEARKKAEDLLKQVKAGADFAELAKKNSEDPGSAKNGGSLGWIGKGRTVPEFEKTAFSLPKGGTSDLVQSSYGFHIIRVDDKQTARLKSLEEVKDQIEPLVKQDKASKLAEAQANKILAQARTDGFDKAVAGKGLVVVSPDYVGRTDTLPGLGNAPQFMDALFNASEKSPVDMVQLPQGYAIFSLEGIRPPATPTFDQIRARVETEFKNERAGTLLTQKTAELADRAKAEHDLRKAAKELGATVKTSDLVLPDGQVPDVGSMSGGASVAFSMKEKEISGPITAGNNGIVLAILEKQEPVADDYAKKKDQIRDTLVQQKQGELFGLFVNNLRDEMQKSGKIKINQEEMKTLTHSQGEPGE